MTLNPLDLISRLLILMIAFPIHEFSHAWVADRFGDPLPRRDGRLTLSPAAHLDVMGSIILLLSGFGWARPVMISPSALRRSSPWAPMLVALAGPLSNLLLAIIFALPLRMGWLPVVTLPNDPSINIIQRIFDDFVWINLVLLFFNLIPLAPLDGEKILEHFLPGPLAEKYEEIRPYGPLILMALLFIGPMTVDILGWTLGPLVNMVYGILVG